MLGQHSVEQQKETVGIRGYSRCTSFIFPVINHQYQIMEINTQHQSLTSGPASSFFVQAGPILLHQHSAAITSTTL